MRLKTRIFVAKALAKKHYAGAMDAMKSLKSKIKKPTDIKAKAMAAGSKVKTFAAKAKKNPGVQGFGKGLGIGTLAVGGIAVGDGAYNLATGKRNVKVDKKTAARMRIKKIKKQYNI